MYNIACIECKSSVVLTSVIVMYMYVCIYVCMYVCTHNFTSVVHGYLLQALPYFKVSYIICINWTCTKAVAIIFPMTKNLPCTKASTLCSGTT